jgi:hypothetical protein
MKQNLVFQKTQIFLQIILIVLIEQKTLLIFIKYIFNSKLNNT